MNIDTGAVTTLTTDYDNCPIWSPRGDRIVFSRVVNGDYEIYTMAPDGTGVKRLTPRSATTRTRAGRPTASTSCSRAAGWDSRTKAPTPTRRSRTASCS
jgi:Tol biopolymer transport system component